MTIPDRDWLPFLIFLLVLNIPMWLVAAKLPVTRRAPRRVEQIEDAAWREIEPSVTTTAVVELDVYSVEVVRS